MSTTKQGVWTGIFVAAVLTACRSDEPGSTGAGASGAGDTTNGGGGSSATDGGSSGSVGGGGAGTSDGGAGGSTECTPPVYPACGTPAGCKDATVEATIADITSGTVAAQTDVELKGVVAMSQKFLVSKSSSGSCLWGVFVSAPGLDTTEANSGTVVLSYGTNALTDCDGKTYCPKLGTDPTCDAIPDDVKPGDVFDLKGETSYYKPTCSGDGESQVPMRQVGKTCEMTKTGTAAVPEPAVVSDLDSLASPTDTDFHDAWGGVKVRIEDVSPVVQGVGGGGQGGAGGADEGEVVGAFGKIKLDDPSNLEVGDKIYYRGYAKKDNVCYDGPQFSGDVEWTRVDGFHYLNFCTWGLEPNDKCSDFDPSSTDCTSADMCAQ